MVLIQYILRTVLFHLDVQKYLNTKDTLISNLMEIGDQEQCMIQTANIAMTNLTKKIAIFVSISKIVDIEVNEGQSIEEAAYDCINGIKDDWEIENIITTEV